MQKPQKVHQELEQQQQQQNLSHAKKD